MNTQIVNQPGAKRPGPDGPRTARHRFGLCVAAISLTAAAFVAPVHAQDRTAGQVVDDATITAQVKIEIARADGLGTAYDINVDTYGQKVMLAGFVNAAEDKRKAEEAARRVKGVTEVINNLQVKQGAGEKPGVGEKPGG